jgi:hypothetical protein
MLSAISRRVSGPCALWRQFWLNDSGSVITFLVAVPVLAGVAAIGIETGQLYRTKRQMQGAADAAALAGSVDRLNGKSAALITLDAQFEVQRNGFTNGSNGVSVTVNSPPTSGTNVNTKAAVEVIVTKSAKFSLGGVLLNWLGQTNNDFNMQVRSVAAQNTTASAPTAEGCIVALTDQAEQGVSITNFNNFRSDCSILSYGTLGAPPATVSASSSSITMSNFNNVNMSSGDPNNPAEIWTRGGFYADKMSHVSADAIVQGAGASIYDPYAKLPAPSTLISNSTARTYTGPTGSQTTIAPGKYSGGLTIQNTSSVYFQPGDYYIVDGDLNITAAAGVNNVSCPNCTANNGVTFILTKSSGTGGYVGGVKLSGMNNVTLNAGTSNTYPGVLFFQDPAGIDTPGTMTTGKTFSISTLNNATLGGAIYFPKNRIDISTINNIGGNQTTGCTIFIGRYVTLQGYNNNYKGGCQNFGTTPAGLTRTNTRNKVME